MIGFDGEGHAVLILRGEQRARGKRVVDSAVVVLVPDDDDGVPAPFPRGRGVNGLDQALAVIKSYGSAYANSGGMAFILDPSPAGIDALGGSELVNSVHVGGGQAQGSATAAAPADDAGY